MDKIGICFFTICAAVSIIFAFPLYFAGYERRVDWNMDLSATSCIIVNHTVTQMRCNYQCNFKKKCRKAGDPSTCTTSHETCTRDCWSGSYKTQYIVYEPNITTLEYPTAYGDSIRSAVDVEVMLSKDRPIGKKTDCFYHRSEPYRVIESEYNQNAFLVFAGIFFVFLGMACIGILICTINLRFDCMGIGE